MPPTFDLEQAAGCRVAGVDEAGRGPWAGPVVAAAAILDPDHLPDDLAAGLDDSKKLSVNSRRRFYDRLHEVAEIGVGQAGVAEIDSLNILQATMLAMRRAVAALPRPPGMALIDGNRTPDLPMPARAIVRGDATCFSIAAASIIAKVTRDRIMSRLAEVYPGYGWERNAGYGTAAHQDALARLGVTAEHRRSFRPIRVLIEKESIAGSSPAGNGRSAAAG